ncbi:hypothetical protein IWX65_002707 [Arthrobacter sp. CAN_A214]|uniref:hypothetical protein n=1 Tax=Arthrobacter sp. CAN_A214 TaxID=2787720 RepID=UPI0018CBC0BC
MSDVANNEQEELAVLHVAIFAVPIALAALGGWLASQSVTAAAWLISHRILVEPAGALVPITEYAGLDLVRVVMAVALVFAFGFGIARFKPRPQATTR